MESNVNKFSVVSEIYAQYTEKNKENLIKIARKLLKQQKEDTAIIADDAIPPLQKESEKSGIG